MTSRTYPLIIFYHCCQKVGRFEF